MMRLLILVCMIHLIVSCSSTEQETSDCIEEKVTSFKTSQSDCIGASIISYLYSDQQVYAFSDGQCISDGGTQIWDSDCNSVCFLGGIAGFTDCNGEDFYELAEELMIIWEVN